MSANDLLEGKHALLTGAASGIGLAVVRAFLEAGARCTLCAADATPSTAIKQLRSQAGSRVNYFCSDPQDKAALDSLMLQVHDRHGAFQVFFNHAARPLDGSAFDTPPRSRDLLQKAAMRAALRYMVACESAGSIINVALLAPLAPDAGSRKDIDAALDLMLSTREAALEVACAGIRVNGLVVQDHHRHEPFQRDPLVGASWGGALRRRWDCETCLYDAATTHEEVAHAALFLASDRSRSMTAQTLDINCTLGIASLLDMRGRRPDPPGSWPVA